MRATSAVQRSRLADAARLAGALSVPVAALGAAGALNGIVDSRALFGALAVAVALAVLAAILAISALAGIWMSGAAGARSASMAIVYASPVLAILALLAAALIVYPRLNDVSTDPLDPPRLAGLPQAGAPPDQQQAATQMIAYPDLAPRLYARPAPEVHAAVVALARKRGWVIEQGANIAAPEAAPPSPEPASSTVADPAVEEELEVTVEAAAPMPLLGFAGAVAIRLRETPDGTRVDMRSTFDGAAHDLGLDAWRIRAFLNDLDAALADAKSAPAAAAPQPAG
jgi:hypothetical protein